MISTDRYCHSGSGNGDNSNFDKIVSYALLSWGSSVAPTLIKELQMTFQTSDVSICNGNM